MIEIPAGQWNPQQFLAEAWQREPCLVRRAFPGFQPPIDGNDLAGLSLDPMAESRIVRGSLAAGQWRLQHGPFEADEYDDIGEQDWTLLVQDVEKHYPPLRELLEQFDFLPRWRLDDIMVSFAATGGSVGPHVDQYDVFLLQAEGRRRWDIARNFSPALRTDTELNVLAGFSAETGWDLDPGDMLYLPPGIAHHGVALEPGLTYSIGCRAPSAADLLLGLGETLAETAGEGERFSDPDITPAQRAGELDAHSINALLDLMQRSVSPGDEPSFLADFLGNYLSGYRLAHQPAAPPSAIKADELTTALAAGAVLHGHPWTRIVWRTTDTGGRVFAAGSVMDTSLSLALQLGQGRVDSQGPDPTDSRDIDALVRLVNDGHLVLSHTA